MVIFHSYVKLPEGIWVNVQLWNRHLYSMSMSYPCQVIAKDLGCSQIYSNMGLSENRIPFSHRVPSQNSIVAYRWWCNYLIKPPPLKKILPIKSHSLQGKSTSQTHPDGSRYLHVCWFWSTTFLDCDPRSLQHDSGTVVHMFKNWQVLRGTFWRRHSIEAAKKNNNPNLDLRNNNADFSIFSNKNVSTSKVQIEPKLPSGKLT